MSSPAISRPKVFSFCVVRVSVCDHIG